MIDFLRDYREAVEEAKEKQARRNSNPPKKYHIPRSHR